MDIAKKGFKNNYLKMKVIEKSDKKHKGVRNK